MKLLRNTKNKVNKDKNGENVPRLEVNELVLVQCNIFKKVYQDSRALYTFVSNHVVNY